MAAIKSPISLLQEYLIRQKEIPKYADLPINNGKFHCSVEVHGVVYYGEGVNKKSAKIDAADKALNGLTKNASKTLSSPNKITDENKNNLPVQSDKAVFHRLSINENSTKKIDTSINKDDPGVVLQSFVKNLKDLTSQAISVNKMISDEVIPFDHNIEMNIHIKLLSSVLSDLMDNLPNMRNSKN